MLPWRNFAGADKKCEGPGKIFNENAGRGPSTRDFVNFHAGNDHFDIFFLNLHVADVELGLGYFRNAFVGSQRVGTAN